MRISAIIPALDEEAAIGPCIDSAWREGADQVVVADGGSGDATRAIAEDRGARIVAVRPPQRARQMNAGAAAADGCLLVFLHADTLLEPGSLAALRAAARDPAVVGGGFLRRYESPSRLLAATSRIGNARAARLGWFYGDQAIWARRGAFDAAGGFPERPRFEDLDFARRLRRLGPTRLVAPGVATSARRFDRGAAPRLAKDFLLAARHLCLGPSPGHRP